MVMVWTELLIITHLVPYVLLPAIMYILYSKKEYYQDKVYSYNLLQLAFVALIIAMIGEFLWHWLVQGWEYQSGEYHPLNGLMFSLMVLSFTLIAIGFDRGKLVDVVLVLVTIITPIAYVVGIKPFAYIAQTIGLVALTVRSMRVLQDGRVILFPVFSFGVNMGFISLLFSATDPTIQIIYHILHDIMGTLLGLAIWGYLLWINPDIEKPTKSYSMLSNLVGSKDGSEI